MLAWLGLDGQATSNPGNLGSKETTEAAAEPNRTAMRVKVKILIDDDLAKDEKTRKVEEGERKKEEGKKERSEENEEGQAELDRQKVTGKTE